MNVDETISNMYDILTNIINTLGYLGRTYLLEDMNQKILMSVTPEQRFKPTSINESNDVSIIYSSDLKIQLQTHKMGIIKDEVGVKKFIKRTMALKTAKVIQKSEEVEAEQNDEELAMLKRRLNKIFFKLRNKKVSKKIS